MKHKVKLGSLRRAMLWVASQTTSLSILQCIFASFKANVLTHSKWQNIDSAYLKQRQDDRFYTGEILAILQNSSTAFCTSGIFLATEKTTKQEHVSAFISNQCRAASAKRWLKAFDISQSWWKDLLVFILPLTLIVSPHWASSPEINACQTIHVFYILSYSAMLTFH